jgi:hypothetical protein
VNNHEDPPSLAHSSRRLVAAGGLLLVVVALAAAWLLLARPALAPPGSRNPTPPPARAAAPAPPVATSPAPSPPAEVPSRRVGPKANASPAPPPDPRAPALALEVDSDVPGASVFVDRVYVGRTPLTTSDVTRGSHVLNVSAEGYEAQASTIELTGGTTDVMVRFKVVRLNAAIPVVHKHTIGSCEGRLVADLRGLRYETPNNDHAFAITFPELRSFEVDYLKKNLRVTRRDGKTFNFTDHTANADALFVFHKTVETARAKLAAGLPPANK